MDYFENGVPLLSGKNGLNYNIWRIKKKVCLQEQGHYIWLSVVIGYDSSKREKIASKKELKKNNKIAMDFILEGLLDLVKEKVVKCLSTKELWDKIYDLYFEEYPITEPKSDK